MEIFLFLVGRNLKRELWRVPHGFRWIFNSNLDCVRHQCADIQNSPRILCSICCVLHPALQNMEAQVHLRTKHRHAGLVQCFSGGNILVAVTVWKLEGGLNLLHNHKLQPGGLFFFFGQASYMLAVIARCVWVRRLRNYKLSQICSLSFTICVSKRKCFGSVKCW